MRIHWSYLNFSIGRSKTATFEIFGKLSRYNQAEVYTEDYILILNDILNITTQYSLTNTFNRLCRICFTVLFQTEYNLYKYIIISCRDDGKSKCPSRHSIIVNTRRETKLKEKFLRLHVYFFFVRSSRIIANSAIHK